MAVKKKNAFSEFNMFKKEKNIILVVSKSKDYFEKNTAVLKHLVNNLNLSGIYVTLNKGSKTIKAFLEKNKVDLSKLYFIDAASNIGTDVPPEKNITFIKHGQYALTEISLVISTLCNTRKYDFLFFDSLSTILIYHDLTTAEKFSHYLISKLKQNYISGIILSVSEGAAKDLIPSISQFCDKTIEL